MKSKILLLSVLIFNLLFTQSCVVSKQYLREFRFMFDLTKSAIHGDESWNDPIGFQAGVSGQVAQLSEQMSVRAGALISMQGANWQEGSLEGKTSLWYAYIPAVLRYQHKSGIYGEAGLQPGFLFSAKDKYEGTTDDYMDHMNKFDLSIPLVIGYELKNNIGLNFRVVPGINDITKDDDVKDRNFVIGLGVTYTLKSK